MTGTESEWITAHQAWTDFVRAHPELGYAEGKWQLHNFLRIYRDALVAHDAIRKAKNRFWIAHARRFEQVATGAAYHLAGYSAIAYSLFGEQQVGDLNARQLVYLAPHHSRCGQPGAEEQGL